MKKQIPESIALRATVPAGASALPDVKQKKTQPFV
jgi:hypothetical protein